MPKGRPRKNPRYRRRFKSLSGYYGMLWMPSCRLVHRQASMEKCKPENLCCVEGTWILGMQPSGRFISMPDLTT